MRSSGLFAVASLPIALAFAVAAPQESSPKPAAGAELQMKKEPPPEIWQIDLLPTGTGFTVTKPVLQGDVWVFRVWPDREIVRLPKSKVKNMVRRQQDVDKEVLYRVDLNPSGQMYARDEPKVAGGTYQFHAW